MFGSVACVVLCACAPHLGRDLVELHPSQELRVAPVRVVESSAPHAPAWLSDAPAPRADSVAFVGRAVAPSLDEARAAAGRDLLGAIGSYVGVAVQSRFEFSEEEKTADGHTESTRSVRNEIHTA